VAIGSVIGLVVYVGIDVNLSGNLTGTAETLSVIPVFVLLALVLAGLVASGVRMPARQCSNVDLPDPLGPITATISPGPAAIEAPRSAGVWPNDLTTPRASMIAAGLTAAATSPWTAPGPGLGACPRSLAHRPGEHVQPGRGVIDPPQVRLQVVQAVVGQQGVHQVAVLLPASGEEG
jgi:hypothetical protein